MFSLGFDTTHLKPRGLKFQWVFEKCWIMMSRMQIHKCLPPPFHHESSQWIPRTSWHAIYIGPYLPIHVKYEGNFWKQKDKTQIKGLKKNAPLMSMLLLASLGNHYMKLDNLRVSLSTCIKDNPFQIHLTYFPFLQMFLQFRHAKESLSKRVSKGQHATTNMKNVKVFFVHHWCLAFFPKRLISTSWLQTRMELQKQILLRKLLA
jgi:hypothetical protein